MKQGNYEFVAKITFQTHVKKLYKTSKVLPKIVNLHHSELPHYQGDEKENENIYPEI